MVPAQTLAKPKTQALRKDQTKISYILLKKHKPRLVKAAKALDCSMSEVISRALDQFLKKKEA